MNAREILEEQRIANHELSMARARLVLKYTGNMTIHSMWAQIAIDTEKEQTRADVANMEVKLWEIPEKDTVDFGFGNK